MHNPKLPNIRMVLLPTVDGLWNQVADSLSHYYQYDTIEDEYPSSEFVKVDKLLDPDGDLAPIQWFADIQNNTIRRLQRL